MKLVTTANQLLTALRLVGRAIERRNTYPILGCVLIDGPTLRGTNLEVEIAARVAVTEAQGTAAIDYYRLARLATAIPPTDVVTIEAGKDGATILFSSGRYDLPVFGADDFPAIAKGEDGERTSLEDSGFDEALAFVLPAMSDEETRYYLNGFCISRDVDGDPVLVTTDGHRMAVHPFGATDGWLQGKIVPAQVARIIRHMPGATAVVKYATKEAVRFEWPGATLVTKLIEGTFPDWRRVLPKIDDDDPSITLDRTEVNDALRRLQLFGLKHDSYVTLTFNSKLAVLSMKREGQGAAREFLTGFRTSNLDDRLITVRADYLRTLLQMLAKHRTVHMAFKDGGNPIQITAPGTKAFTILMPARGSHDDWSAQILHDALPVAIGRAA